MLGMNEEKVTLMIDRIVWEKFRRYCSVNAFKISGKIQLLLDEEMERGPKTKNLLDMFKEIVEKETKKDAVKTEQTNLNAGAGPYRPEVREKRVFYNGEINREVNMPVVSREIIDNPKMNGNIAKVPTIEQLMRRRRV